MRALRPAGEQVAHQGEGIHLIQPGLVVEDEAMIDLHAECVKLI